MIHIAIAEDSPGEREKFVRFLRRYAGEKGCEFDVQTYADGADVVSAYRPGIDILFLDIEMPVLDGMRAARILREKDRGVAIVFVTNLAQYAIQGYEVEAMDFIVKPLEWSVFSFRMDRILSRWRRRASAAAASVTLRTDGGALRRIEIPDLLYVEVSRHQLTYHTVGGDLSTRATMREAEEALLGHGFCKCNQCYLVNLRYVTAIDDELVHVGGARLRISRARKKEFINALSEFVATS